MGFCSSERRRVAVTGVGTVTPLGSDFANYWRALLPGDADLLGAPGVIEAIFTLSELETGLLPLPLNLGQSDSRYDLHQMYRRTQSHNNEIALSNAFGFGGTTTCRVFRHGG